MATLTGNRVAGDFYRMVKSSALAEAVSGNVYRSPELRPRDSDREDIVVKFKAGLTGDIQTGEVTVLIFVPDFEPFGNGVLTEDIERTTEIEALAQQWVDSLTADVSCYRLRLVPTIRTVAVAGIPQHAVSIALPYEYKD